VRDDSDIITVHRRVTYLGAMREAKVLEATANIIVDQDMGFIISTNIFLAFMEVTPCKFMVCCRIGDRSLKMVKL